MIADIPHFEPTSYKSYKVEIRENNYSPTSWVRYGPPSPREKESKGQVRISAPSTAIQYEHLKIPPELTHFVASAKESEYILNLEDNWDDEGAPAYSREVWRRAVQFLFASATDLLRGSGGTVPAPVISHGPNGGIDIHWGDKPILLLIHLPAEPAEMATFYGRKQNGSEIKGTFPQTDSQPSILSWLND